MHLHTLMRSHSTNSFYNKISPYTDNAFACVRAHPLQGFGNVDIAELMIYDAALTQQEMDRIGNYLALKFAISSFRIDSDVGSVTRSAAVSKNCGCSGGPPWGACNPTFGPYCEDGVALSSGTCKSSDQNLQVTTGTGNSYLNLGNAGPNPTFIAQGGSWFSVKGQFLLPTDVNRNDNSGIFGTADYATLDTNSADADTVITSRYLAVSIGHVPYACRTAFSTVKCLDSDFIETFATGCKIWMKPSAGTVTGSTTLCAQWVPPSPLPEIRCMSPPGIGPNQDLIIYWHGVATVLSNWFHYQNPLIESLMPTRINYKGGIITVRGQNFGPKASYTEKTQTTADTYQAQVLILNRRQTKCRKTTWVSDRELICEVPPMPPSRVEVDTTARTSKTQVVVEVLVSRSTQSAVSELTFTQVPAYYACSNDRSTSKAAQRECFKCCRSACIVDEFASGARKAGFTYTYCDKECYKYCGYHSGRGRMLLSVQIPLISALLSLVSHDDGAHRLYLQHQDKEYSLNVSSSSASCVASFLTFLASGLSPAGEEGEGGGAATAVVEAPKLLAGFLLLATAGCLLRVMPMSRERRRGQGPSVCARV